MQAAWYRASAQDNGLKSGSKRRAQPSGVSSARIGILSCPEKKPYFIGKLSANAGTAVIPDRPESLTGYPIEPRPCAHICLWQNKATARALRAYWPAIRSSHPLWKRRHGSWPGNPAGYRYRQWLRQADGTPPRLHQAIASIHQTPRHSVPWSSWVHNDL